MGVPAFFRWLTVRYPKVVIDALNSEDLDAYDEEYRQQQARGDANEIALEDEDPMVTATRLNQKAKTNAAAQQSNPAIDNLYLDMNGIIHPCARPEGGDKPNCEEDIFANVFEYTDKVIRLCRPKKVIYMAIDGVAPRAKLN